MKNTTLNEFRLMSEDDQDTVLDRLDLEREKEKEKKGCQYCDNQDTQNEDQFDNKKQND